jgi:ribosomal protein S3
MINSRVTEWRFEPQAATGFRRHAYDRVVVRVRNRELELAAGGKRLHSKLEQGKSYFRKAASRMTSSMPAAARGCLSR